MKVQGLWGLGFQGNNGALAAKFAMQAMIMHGYWAGPGRFQGLSQASRRETHPFPCFLREHKSYYLSGNLLAHTLVLKIG